MPSKKTQPQTFTCPGCTAVVLQSSRSKHTANICSYLKDHLRNDAIDVDSSISFFFRGSLFSKVNSHVKESCVGVKVLLNPASLKLCSLALDQPVLVYSASGQTTMGIIWVDKDVPVLNTRLQSWSPHGPLVRIVVPECPVFKANKVVLKIDQDKLASRSLQLGESADYLQDFVAQKLQNLACFDGQTISIRYMGQNLDFKVCKVELGAPCDFSLRETEETVISDLKNLSLNESSGSLNASAESSTLDYSPMKKVENQIHFPEVLDFPTHLCVMDGKTVVQILWPDDQQSRRKSFADLGGLKREKKFLFDYMISPFSKLSKSTEKSENKSISLLIHGVTGSGKTVLLEAAMKELSEFTVLNFNSKSAEADKEILSLFSKAAAESMSMIVIDDLDMILKSDSNTVSDSTRKVQQVLCQELDKAASTGIYTLCATNSVEKLPSSVRRRFDLELEVFVPTPDDRLEILKHLVSVQVVDPDILSKLALKAHGYTPSDLQSLCKFATSTANIKGTELSASIFEEALAKIRPSALREITLEVPKVHWSDIGGMSEVKDRLKEMVEWPIKHPEAFVRLGIEPPRGVLLYGPPGCSKTMIARALATESDMNFFAVKGPELFSKWVGESERTIRELFRKARSAAPSIVFFDEIDAIATSRSSSAGNSAVGDRVLTQLLTELDGVEPLTNVVVVAATNRPDTLDAALLRPGRFDRLIYIPLPDAETRREILYLQFQKIPLSSGIDRDSILTKLVEQTDGFSGAEIKALSHETALRALSRNLSATEVQEEDLLSIFESDRKPRISIESLAIFEKFVKSGKWE